MKSLGWLSVIALVGLVACSPAKKEAGAQPGTNSTVGENPLSAPADYLGAVNAAHKSAVRTVDITSVSKAIQMFEVSEGRYPNDLNELVTQQYLPRLPALPAGMKYSYDPNTGQVKAVPQ